MQQGATAHGILQQRRLASTDDVEFRYCRIVRCGCSGLFRAILRIDQVRLVRSIWRKALTIGAGSSGFMIKQKKSYSRGASIFMIVICALDR